MTVDNLALLLRAREEELSAIYENVPGILFYIAIEPDGQFRFVSVSRDFLVATGMNRGQILGSLVRDVIPPPSRDTVLNHYREAILSGQTVRWEEESVYPAGRRYGEVAVTPLYDASGVATHLIGIVHDVTARKRLEESLRESEERLRLAMSSGNIGFWDWDVKSGRVTWSRELEESYGWDHPGYYDASSSRVHPDDLAAVESERDAAIRNHKPFDLEFRIVLPSGEIRWLSSRGRGHYDENGGVVHVVGIDIDITEGKQAEEALRQADRRKNEFLAVLAHELRNPLAALSIGLQLVRRKSEAEPTLHNLDMMDRQLTQLVRLVDDLLDVGRISTGKIRLKLQLLTLPQVLANSMEEARAAIDSRHHEVLVQIQPGQHRVRGDSARLTQVIANLIENAAKYTEPGGQIRLSLSHEDGAEVVRVEDNGIPAGELTHVFDLFSQVRIHQGKSAEGLGIGLAIVRTLVELHRGTVDAASSGLGRGSTFTVRLPALEEGISTPVLEVLPQGRLKGSQSRRRVLIVDDNEDAAAALAEFLGLEGHKTWIAHDGLQAIEIVKANELDVVLMDVGMPGLDGIETAKRIRTLPGCERLRMAALTGWGQASDRARTREAGLDWHLVKPINTTFLSELIAKLEPVRHAQSGT